MCRTNNIKLIHCIGSLGFGGIERLVHDLVTLQNRRDNFEVAIGVSTLKGEFKEDFEKLDSRLYNLDLSSGFDINPFKIIKILRIFKQYDVLHLHGFNLSVAVCALLSGKKVIYTEHGNFGFGRKINAVDKLSFILRKQFFKFKKINICCNSSFTREYVLKHFYSGKRIKVVYNGVNLDNGIDDKLKLNLIEKYADNFIIGTSSRLAGFKKIERLISLFSSYNKINPKTLLVIVGDGIEKKNLEKKVKELNLENSILFEGYQREVATFHNLFDVCVFPSINEPFGLVAIECYSKMKPVLVFSDGGGLTEIVEKFEKNDICDSAEKMIKRLQYYEKNTFIPKNDFYNNLEFFSVKRMEEDYYKEYIL